MKEYWHSVMLDQDFCNGCTKCLDKCPTQAIRIVKGKAKIINERCIDCGECLRVCHFHAKGAQCDHYELIKDFKYTIALPCISIYGQFPLNVDMENVFKAFYDLGFDKVYDVAKAADILSEYQREVLEEGNIIKPVISTYCPAITRLIQVRYPSLIDNITKLESPLEVAARLVKKQVMDEHDLKANEIGIFYIAECPAKVTSVKKPIGIEKSAINGVLSFEALYTKLLKSMESNPDGPGVQEASHRGVGWAMVAGQSIAIDNENYMAVDGIDEVIKVLDKIELGKLNEIDFLEAYACVTGCVGGPMNVENPFVAKSRVRLRSKQYKKSKLDLDEIGIKREDLEWDQEMAPRQILKLDSDFKIALEKMAKIEEIAQKLPGIDCGACGSPTCRALAEDIVMGRSKIEDCLVRQAKILGGKNED